MAPAVHLLQMPQQPLVHPEARRFAEQTFWSRQGPHESVLDGGVEPDWEHLRLPQSHDAKCKCHRETGQSRKVAATSVSIMSRSSVTTRRCRNLGVTHPYAATTVSTAK